MSDKCVRSTVAEMKARQAAKLKEIREALRAEGYTRLAEQAVVLGLPRSTTWTVVQGTKHKASGLSAPVLRRILSSPGLPHRVRIKVVEYVVEKSIGQYGGTHRRLQVFADRMKQSSAEPGERPNAIAPTPP